MNDKALNRIEFQVENFEEHFKKRKPLKKIGEKLKEAAKNLSDNDAVYLPIVPFKKVLKKRLDKKGVKYASNHISDIAKAFYKSEIEGTNFESYLNEAPATAPAKDKSAPVDIPGSVVGIAAKVVEAVINFIKQKKEDQVQGKTGASDDELLLDLDDAASAAESLSAADLQKLAMQRKGDENTAGTTPPPSETKMMDPTTILVIVAVVVAVYFFSK
jgi:hypothetical protein